MSVFYCPACPLIFEHRTEVEWHLRNEHRSRSDEELDLRAELSAEHGEIDEARVRALELARADVAVSLLMATTPGPALSGLDVARLRHLANLTRRRLRQEPGVQAGPNLEHRLARAVAAAEGRPADRGLAIFVSASELAILRLPFEPSDRAVVDPRFATRDLRYALQHHPRYRVLLLGPAPRILEGRGQHLTDVAGAASSQARGSGRGPGRGIGRRSIRPERWTVRAARHSTGVMDADRMIDRRIDAAGPMPLVIVGENRWRSAFRQLSAHTAAVVAEIQGSRARASAAEVAEISQPALAGWDEVAQASRVAEMHRVDAQGGVRWGLAPAWNSVTDGTADYLWIERDYAQPGRLRPDPLRPDPFGQTPRSPSVGARGMEMTADPAEPGVCDDLVEELIQAATARGIPVDLVESTVLGGPAPVAARIEAHARPASPGPVERVGDTDGFAPRVSVSVLSPGAPSEPGR